MSKIKICGLKSSKDIEIVNCYKPDYCGFIINFPKSHRSITPEKVGELTGLLKRDFITPVGVFVDSPLETVVRLLNEGAIDIAQLHGNESEEYIKEVKALTGKPVIKAFKIMNQEDLERALESLADYILLDRGKGEGKTFDWTILEDFKEKLETRKWFLAGGIDINNAGEAIRRFNPYCIDLSSAVETEGVKDSEKVSKIIEEIRKY